MSFRIIKAFNMFLILFRIVISSVYEILIRLSSHSGMINPIIRYVNITLIFSKIFPTTYYLISLWTFPSSVLLFREFFEFTIILCSSFVFFSTQSMMLFEQCRIPHPYVPITYTTSLRPVFFSLRFPWF